MKEDAHFANVEFELECKLSLKPLLDELGEKISVHYHDRLENGNDFASFDVRGSGFDWNVDKTISVFCNLVETLLPSGKEIWSKCVRRELDIGFGSGNSGVVFEGRIESETPARVANIGATIEITIYPIAPIK